MIFLVGNWKMAPEKGAQAITLFKKTNLLAKAYKKTLTVIACVPSVHLVTLTRQRVSPIKLGAQTVASTVTVAHTGLVHSGMLKDAGVSYCIVGHSESRARGEGNDLIREQALRLIEKKITPIFCVGERERDPQGWYLSEVKEQLETLLVVLPKTAYKSLIVAYEPVWAIGKDAVREATPIECQEMIIFIRKVIADAIGEKAASLVPILYGGSVTEVNARSFIIEGRAQGLLVGRASLDPKVYGQLAKSISK